MSLIELPWPDRRLSPNARVHWRAKHQASKVARELAFALTKAKRIRLDPGLVPINIIFEAPDRRLRDDDNAISAFKPYRDGIADALGVDDSIFRPVYRFGEPFKGGRVTVEIVEVGMT